MDDTLAEIMTKLRSKWCDDLEDMLQCPICMLCPKNMFIYQCVEGHHICENCKLRLLACPTCNKSWSVYRNRLAENMCSKFDDIKSSLIDPEAKINELLIPDKFCVATQTDNDEVDTVTEAVAVCAVAPKPVIAPQPSIPVAEGHSGFYPCCVDNCKVNLCFDALIGHIRDLHPLNFLELPLGSELTFQHTWLFPYFKDWTHDRVIRIANVGTFVLKASWDIFGTFRGYVMMIHCGVVAKQFSYELRIGNKGNSTCSAYTDNVYSCRAPAETFVDKGLLATFEDLSKANEEWTDGQLLTCSLFLARKLDDTQTLKINAAKKKRPKNRNNNTKGYIVL